MGSSGALTMRVATGARSRPGRSLPGRRWRGSSSRISTLRSPIWRSTGTAWTTMSPIFIGRLTAERMGRIDAGIPRDSFVNVIREDPAAKGLLYAGTERGMFMSLDDGAHWQPLQQNLPMTSVRDIDVHGDDLVIATHGRGFWIMDDVSALRQMGTLHPGEAVLFKPATAFRVRPSNFTARPCPRMSPWRPILPTVR